ncbi:MAG: glycosyltransferase [Bacteroidetes bacterium]|nr:glycosyltransferase [Bacteroidota bacterium]
MQRVATELHAALEAHPDVTLRSVLLRTSWRWTHLRTLPFLIRAYLEISKLSRREAIDAVLFSSMVTASLTVPLRRLLAERGIASAAILHGRDVTLPVPPYQWFVPHVFRSLDAALPVSRATGAQAMDRGLAPDKLHVVPNGVDTARFSPPGDRDAARRTLTNALGDPAQPLPEDALLLCSVGRQVERKGFAWFIDHVMPRLPETVHYWLAGDGPEAITIDAAIARNDLAGRVRRLGRVTEEELELLYRGADLFVMPNRPVPGDMEGFGVVMLEAGLCGLPTVAARLEGIQDVITEGVNGHLIESGDAQSFADAILRYHDAPDRLRATSARASRHTVDTFSWRAVADRYVEVLQEVKSQVG